MVRRTRRLLEGYTIWQKVAHDRQMWNSMLRPLPTTGDYGCTVTRLAPLVSPTAAQVAEHVTEATSSS